MSYAIAIDNGRTAPSDVAAGIKFAKDNNIRLVVKNTGHDYAGRSTGKGALSIWMAKNQGHTIIRRFRGGNGNYSGPAMRLATGTQGYQAMQYARAAGYRVVGGECPTVGIAGGYATGGGHSLLSSSFGMAADSVLEWEVVTPQGKHVTARADGEYSDLYWAMTGGGGGTWGVALSMTVKAYPEGRIGGADFSFSADGVPPDTYWAATRRLHAFMVNFTDQGNTATWAQTRGGFAALSITMPDQTAEAAKAAWAPLLGQLDELKVSYRFKEREWGSYYEHYDELMGPLPYGGASSQASTSIFTSRIVPRELVRDAESDSAKRFAAAVEKVTNARDGRFVYGCTALSVGAHGRVPGGANGDHADNSVLSSWREAMAMCVIVTPWDRAVPHEDMVALKRFTVDELVPAVEDATPGGGVYLNELDPLYKGDWKNNGFGRDKYARLLAIKNKYDPDHVFWQALSVGGDAFETDDDGRVCKA